jgi:NFU1 iron-sulfur cluster scaffold homolog, mitochondrial
MSEKKIPVAVYSESTPNPATMKFVANHMFLKDGGTIEFTSPDQTEDAPLAARLFTFPFVTGVFFAKNFITISKNDAVEWMEITNEMREYLINYLTAGYPVFNKKPQTQAGSNIPPVPQNQQEERITEILQEYIRPAVESDGGAIDFKKFEEGKLTVTLRGACSGCPSSTITLKNGIEQLFKRMMPEVKEVVAEEL